MRSIFRASLFAIFALAISAFPRWAAAQTVITKGGRTVRLPSAVAQAKPGTPPGQPSAAKPGAKPGGAAKPGDPKKDAKPAAGSTAPIKRPAKPTEEPKPEELKLLAIGKDEVRFSFKGAPWLTVLEQLAAKSEYNLDYQELPGDHLNLITRRSYKLNEARDLINRHLLARGYTMILHDEVLSVVSLKKIKELNPAVVPEVAPEDLAKLMPHEYVRTSFMLDTLIAKDLAEQLKPMISPEHGRLHAVEALNRIEAMDTVANLRQIHRLIQAESSDKGQERVLRVFKLEYTRATDILAQLKKLLGVKDSNAPAAPMTPQQRQQMQQRAAQQGKKPQGGAKKEEGIHLIVNSRSNSILATAPPNKLAVIMQAVKALDVPADPSQSLFNNIDRMQTYRLSGLDPETLKKMLEDMGGLDISTRLEIDKKNKAIIAYASLADHLMISKLKEKLDGSGRSFEVIPLKRYEADYVAGTIKVMMGVEEKKKSSGRRNYWSSYSQPAQKEEKNDKFHVEGDVENNRLLLMANEVELAEVENLLVKLGEIPARGGNRSRMRVLDSVSPDDAEELLRRLRKVWPGLSPNELILPPEEKKPESKETPATDPADASRKSASVAKPSTVVLANFFAGEQQEAAPAEKAESPPVEKAEQPRKAAPVTKAQRPTAPPDFYHTRLQRKADHQVRRPSRVGYPGRGH